MEQKFLSILSVYDFLAMVIPGGTIMAVAGNFFGFIPFCINDCIIDKYLTYVVLLIVAYLIGIIYACLVEWIFKGYRDSTIFMWNALSKVCDENSDNYLKYVDRLVSKSKRDNIGRNSCILLDSLRCLCSCILYRLCCLCKCLKCKCLVPCLNKVSHIDDYKAFKGRYYEAYYFVSAQSKNSTISVIESQVALIRNMLIPLLLITIDIDSYFYNFSKCGCVLVVFFLLLAMVSRQNKIYERVWEDYIYLKCLEENRKQ